MLIQNDNQRQILFAEQGLDRWHAATVARAILRRIEKAGETITITELDVTTINRMAEVLHLGGRFNSPFGQFPVRELEVPTTDILRVFE